MPKGILKLIEPNGTETLVLCKDVPPQGGAGGTLTIEGVSRKVKTDSQGHVIHDFISIPRLPPGSAPPPDVAQEDVIKIELTEDINEDHLVLPYNGGIPHQELSVKFKLADQNPPDD